MALDQIIRIKEVFLVVHTCANNNLHFQSEVEHFLSYFNSLTAFNEIKDRSSGEGTNAWLRYIFFLLKDMKRMNMFYCENLIYHFEEF